jgi:hypothetical protein
MSTDLRFFLDEGLGEDLRAASDSKTTRLEGAPRKRPRPWPAARRSVVNYRERACKVDDLSRAVRAANANTRKDATAMTGSRARRGAVPVHGPRRATRSYARPFGCDLSIGHTRRGGIINRDESSSR